MGFVQTETPVKWNPEAGGVFPEQNTDAELIGEDGAGRGRDISDWNGGFILGFFRREEGWMKLRVERFTYGNRGRRKEWMLIAGGREGLPDPGREIEAEAAKACDVFREKRSTKEFQLGVSNAGRKIGP
ncbi:unnamed protein product [Linum trigynum]|uniref:Uncharacterized protein n=1 Tax=Linum trigynum TaxID=586398 RepID=A0AAV2EFR4_9ROSI